MRAESAVVFFSPGFILPALWKGAEPQPGEGAGKKHLITGVSLLVTRRWQRLPWVSRFRERRVFCLEARGLLRSLPWLGGRPRLSQRPLSTPASAARAAGLPLCGPPQWPGQRVVSPRVLKLKARGGGELIAQRRIRPRTNPHTPHSGPGHAKASSSGQWPMRDLRGTLLLAVAGGRPSQPSPERRFITILIHAPTPLPGPPL